MQQKNLIWDNPGVYRDNSKYISSIKMFKIISALAKKPHQFYLQK